jgi:hypothetical protein
MAKTNVKPSDNVIALGAVRPHTPPSHLEQEEAELWRRLTRTYVLDDPASLEILGTALAARGRMRNCREKIDEAGELIKDRWGQFRANPLLVAERGARDSYLKALRILNLDLAGSTR